MAYLDFDSLIISNNDYDIDSLRDLLSFFSSLGIRRFIVTRGVDLVASSAYDALCKYKQLKAAIPQFKPYGAKVWVAPNIYLSKDVSRNPCLHRLSLAKTDRIFVQTPLFVDGSWLDADLNYLLYKQKFKTIFVCFERNLITCSRDYAMQLYKIQKSMFCLDINYMTSKDTFENISTALKENISILPSVSGDRASYVDTIAAFELLRTRLGDRKYLALCKHINTSVKEIFNQL